MVSSLLMGRPACPDALAGWPSLFKGKHQMNTIILTSIALILLLQIYQIERASRRFNFLLKIIRGEYK